MERALALGRLRAALADASRLPSAEHLADLLAEVEVSLFLRTPKLPEVLLQAAWYLHGIAQADGAAETYSRNRRLESWRISAHVFDLALEQENVLESDKLRFAFAAQLGYLHGEQHPNAAAIYRRVRKALPKVAVQRPDPTALTLGITFLGMDRARFYPALQTLERQLAALARDGGVDTLRGTYAWGLSRTAVGCRLLMRFLLRGGDQVLEDAERALHEGVAATGGERFLDARWVAANLRHLRNTLRAASVWTVLPPQISNAAKRAFTHGRPSVMNLWPPQIDLVSPHGETSPLDPAVRRVVLSTPTSSGKTLISQLFALNHLDAAGSGVCFVVPTRSLGREVRRGLSDRLQLFRSNVEPEVADWLGVSSAGDVEVMTPERLAHLVRNDLTGLLAKFGMFVFDEVHTLADESRGMTVEGCLSLLHWVTQKTSHRIMVMSAALGNRGEIAGWIDPEGAGVAAGSDWRGPRRLHAVYTTDVRWDQEKIRQTRSRRWPTRSVYPMIGVIRLRISATGKVATLTISEPVGEFVVRRDSLGQHEKNERGRRKAHSSTTPLYKTFAGLVGHLGEAGPVLVVRYSRRDTQLLAGVLAEQLPERPELLELANFVRSRLGAEHPLSNVVSRGVVFHHAGLPTDVLSELENSIHDGQVRFIVATTSLTDGVNLPVRTVLVDEPPSWARPMSPSQVINAFGRAGRACVESEGWAVLARHAAPDPEDFSRLSPQDADLHVTSVLASTEAMEELANFEVQLRSNADAVFRAAGTRVADFMSYVWLVLAVAEELNAPNPLQHAESGLRSMLAWAQLTVDDQLRWQRVARAVGAAFATTPKDQRRRWSRIPTSLSTARRLDILVERLVEEVAGSDVDFYDPMAFVDLLAASGVLLELRALPEAAEPKVHNLRSGQNRLELEVDQVGLLKAWMSGLPIAHLADKFFTRVRNTDYRYEQLGDYLTSCFEHHLSWTLGVLIQSANDDLPSLHPSRPCLDPHFASYVRHGVGNPLALTLLTNGVRSRGLAHAVSTAALDSGVRDAEGLREWLCSLSLEDWRGRFDAAPTDIKDLMLFVRDRVAQTVALIFEGGQARIALGPGLKYAGPVSLGTQLPPQVGLGVFGPDGTLVAAVPTAFQADLDTLLEVGIPYRAEVVEGALGRSLHVRLAEV